MTILTGKRYSNAVTGKVFGGYGAMLNPCWYLGGELFIQGDANVSRAVDIVVLLLLRLALTFVSVMLAQEQHGAMV